ncbi:MAG: ATPase, T2SS/T4P/T4SS family [Deltaproteobacteria bacterium]|nr:ATPase, T2SS/T4P/T4SS family [Deltaproteobacteria bacterium]
MPAPRPTSDANLLRYLIQHGLLEREQVDSALAEIAAEKSDLSVLEWLGRRGTIVEEELAFTVAGRLRLPFVNLATCSFDPAVVGLIRDDVAARYRALALSQEGRILTVGMVDPLDREAVRAIEFATGHRVRLAVVTASGLREALRRAYNIDASLNAYLQTAPGEAEVPITALEDDVGDVELLRNQSALPPVVKLLNMVLLDGIRSHASDIHIEAATNEVRVRYRVDGMLQDAFQFPKWVHDPMVTRCKVLAKLDITERQKPQDGRIRVEHRDTMVDLRVSSLPTQFGEKITLRILNAAAAPPGLEPLNLNERDLRVVRQAIARPQGLVLVTGPTGSGKTTTLYSMLAEIHSSTRNIVTIENPIEYHIKGVNQVQINERRGLTFANTLRSILRQDPDVILVGEIRDRETAEIAVQAAQTGHLVLSTLHTNDSVATLTRLVDLGIEPHVLGPSLNLIIAQRLVRRICEQCTQTYTGEPIELRSLHLPAETLLRRGSGCQSCHEIGYTKRVAVIEVMALTPAMTRLVEQRAADSALRRQALADGMTPLARAARQMVLDGVTTAEEVLRAVDMADSEPHCPHCDRVVDERFAVCPHCATPLKLVCTGCQKSLDPEWHACPYCGAVRGAAPVPVRPPAASPAAAPAPRPRRFEILVVDDEPDFRHLLAMALHQSDLPVAVTLAADGAEALQLAEHHPPDLVLLDIGLPNVDGFEVCARLRAAAPTAEVPILMLTAYDDSENRERGFVAGTDDYIGKPFSHAELLARVRRILQRTYGYRPAVVERAEVA